MRQDGTGVAQFTTSLGKNTQPDAGAAGTASSGGSAFSLGMLGNSWLSASSARTESSEPSPSPTTIASVENGLKVAIESKLATAGDTVSLAVSLEGAQDLGNLAFDIRYDGTKLTLLSIASGDFLADAVVAINPENLPSESGLIRFNWVKVPGFTGAGDIMTLTFKIAPDARGEELTLAPELHGYFVSSEGELIDHCHRSLLPVWAKTIR